MQKVVTAIDLLNDLYTNTPKLQDQVYVKGLYLNRLMVKTCRKYYELALQVFLGEGMIVLLNHIVHPFNLSDLHQKARSIDSTGKEEWLDLAGLLTPYSQVERITKDCKSGRLDSLQALLDRIGDLYNAYRTSKATFFKAMIRERRNINLSVITAGEIEQIIEEWRTASVKLNNMILIDAEKEFDQMSHIGYGISAVPDSAQADFEAVHGEVEENGFVYALKKEIMMINEKADAIIRLISDSLR